MVLLMIMLLVEPTSRWQVSFDPEIALVCADGVSVLFRDRELYIFDAEGAPVQNVTLDFAPEQAWIGPDDRVMVYDGEGLLGALNESHNLSWQREMAPPRQEPFVSNGLMTYVTGNDVLLLDPEDGEARFSRRMQRPVTAVAPLDDWLLISDSGERVLAWGPRSGLERVRGEPYGEIRFASRSPSGHLALVTKNGLLEVTLEDRRVPWRRRHHIDITVPPIWLASERQEQLLVATLGRRIYAYGAHGRLLATHLLPARITDTIAFPDAQVLVVSQLHDQLLWYEGDTTRFRVENLDARVRNLSDRGDFVLMVDEDGMISLYEKRAAR